MLRAKCIMICLSYLILGIISCDIFDVEDDTITEETTNASIIVVNEDSNRSGRVYNLGERTNVVVGSNSSRRFTVPMTVAQDGRLRTTLFLKDIDTDHTSTVVSVSFYQGRGIVPTVIFRHGWSTTRVVY